MRVLVCLFRTCFLPLGIGSHLSPDGGGFSLATSETTFQDAVVVSALRAAKLNTLWEIC